MGASESKLESVPAYHFGLVDSQFKILICNLYVSLILDVGQFWNVIYLF